MSVEVLELAVADDLVGHPAGLGALAPVGRAAAERLAGEALARVGDAEGAVDEDLDGQARLPADPGDLVERKLAGQDHARAAQLAGQPDPFLAGDRHLGRGVDLQVGRDRADQPGEAEVLDDHRVDARLGHAPDGRLEVGQLAGEDQRVERDVAPDAPAVEQGHHLGQVGAVEVGGPGPGVVPLEAEIDGVGAVLDGRDQAVRSPAGASSSGLVALPYARATHPLEASRVVSAHLVSTSDSASCSDRARDCSHASVHYPPALPSYKPSG